LNGKSKLDGKKRVASDSFSSVERGSSVKIESRLRTQADTYAYIDWQAWSHIPRRGRAPAGRTGERLNLWLVAEPDLTFRLLDGGHATGLAPELLALRSEVYGNPSQAVDRFRVQCRQPGFILALASHGSYPIGYAAGMPLRPSTSWWRQLTTPLPEAVTAEHSGRTFALTDLLVRAAWRRQGVGQTLHDLELKGRTEERATLVVAPSATAAQAAFQSWGWRKIARALDPDHGPAVFDVLLRSLDGAGH
jgi:ribosomal protein S18 acetylase RimI-like enzyme